MSEPCEIKHMSLHQYCETVLSCPSCSWFAEVFYGNPDCKTQCENFPCSAQYPGHLGQELATSLEIIITQMHAGKDELFWCLCHQPGALKPLINDQSLPLEICLLCITPNTSTLTICKAMKFIIRKKSIFLDCWYMACNRVIIMTCMIYQLLNQYYRGTAVDSNSPPTIADTMKPVQYIMRPVIRPGEFS